MFVGDHTLSPSRWIGLDILKFYVPMMQKNVDLGRTLFIIGALYLATAINTHNLAVLEHIFLQCLPDNLATTCSTHGKL